MRRISCYIEVRCQNTWKFLLSLMGEYWGIFLLLSFVSFSLVWDFLITSSWHLPLNGRGRDGRAAFRGYCFHDESWPILRGVAFGLMRSSIWPGNVPLQPRNQRDQQVKAGDCVPLSALLLWNPSLELCVHLWGPQHRKEMDLLDWVQRRAIKLIRGMEHLYREGRLRALRLFSL